MGIDLRDEANRFLSKARKEKNCGSKSIAHFVSLPLLRHALYPSSNVDERQRKYGFWLNFTSFSRLFGRTVDDNFINMYDECALCMCTVAIIVRFAFLVERTYFSSAARVIFTKLYFNFICFPMLPRSPSTQRKSTQNVCMDVEKTSEFFGLLRMPLESWEIFNDEDWYSTFDEIR